MAPTMPTDPIVKVVVEHLIGLSSSSNDEQRTIVKFVLEEGSSDRLSILSTHMLYDDDFLSAFESAGFPVHIYISRSGAQLQAQASLLRDKIKELEALVQDPDYVHNFEEVLPAFALFIELSPQSHQATDADQLSGKVFEVVRSAKIFDWPARTPEDTARNLLKRTPHITRHLAPILNLSRKQYAELFETRLAEQTSNWMRFLNDKLFQGVAILYEFVGSLSEDLAQLISTNSKMPPELWDPAKRPRDYQKFIRKVEKDLKTSLNAVKAKLADLNVDFYEELKSRLPFGLAESFEKFQIVSNALSQVGSTSISIMFFHKVIQTAQTLWEGLLDLLTQVINDILRNIESAKDTMSDSLDAVIGYFSGLWDGIMDAVIGILQLAGLALNLLAKYIRESGSRRRLRSIVFETYDEINQALSRVKWIELWNYLRDDGFEKILTLIKLRIDMFIDEATHSPAKAGYYIGYAVYMILELLFPPLKITKVSQASKVAHTAGFFRKVFP